MPMQNQYDTQSGKPRFPVERTQRGTVKVSANSQTNIINTLNVLPSIVTSLANGYVAAGVNVSTSPAFANNGLAGFNEYGPTITNIQGTTITLSNNTSGAINAGQVITFSKPIVWAGALKSNTYANTYNANTVLVTAGRIANANATFTYKGVAHTGWVHVQVGTGFVKALTIAAPGRGAANGFITFTANTSYPGGSGANASYTVNANGSVISITMNSLGSGYVVTPSVNTTPGSNAVISVTMGGRANRIQTEVLSVVGNAQVLTATSGGIWFPGS